VNSKFNSAFYRVFLVTSTKRTFNGHRLTFSGKNDDSISRRQSGLLDYVRNCVLGELGKRIVTLPREVRE